MQRFDHSYADDDDRNTPGDSQDHGWLTRERALGVLLFAMTALAIYLCYLLAQPFLPALAWASALAVVAHPLHRWMSSRVSNDNLSAGLTLLLVAVLLVVPAIFVGHNLVSQVRLATERLGEMQEQASNGQIQKAVEDNPQLGPAFGWIQENVDLQAEVRRGLDMLASGVSSLVTGSVFVAAQLLFTLFTLFFFFRDHRAVLRTIRSLLPLSDAETDDMYARVNDTIYATIYGTLTVAMLQGALGGLMFWWLGRPAPLLWAVVMGLLSIVPYLGSFVVWGPVAVFMALQGEWTKALILGGWGLIVIGLIDNFVYPILVGKRLRMHPLLAFIAIVGGIAVFGTSGMVLGPVIVAVTEALIHVWRCRSAHASTVDDGVNAPQTCAAKPLAAGHGARS